VLVRNIKTGEMSSIEANGVFFFVGTVPKTGFLEGVVELDSQGYIIANDMMETSQEGVYAVGDARQKFLRQVITAAADGAIAAVAAEKYLQETESFRSQVLDAEKPVLAYFWAPQNEDSVKAMSGIEKIRASLGTEVQLVKIDTYRNRRIAKMYKVSDIPTGVLFRAGEVVKIIDKQQIMATAGIERTARAAASS